MIRVDAHHHLWDLDRRPQDWLGEPRYAPLRRTFTPEDLAADAAEQRIDRTVLVQVLPDSAETREFLAVADGSALIAGVVGWADLTAPDLADELAALREGPGGDRLAGIRHLVQGEPDPDWLTRPEVLRGLAVLAGHGLVYNLLVTPVQLPAAVAAVRAVPQLSFVLDHAAKPLIHRGVREPWAGQVAALAAAPNTACKLSGLATEAISADPAGPADWSVADLAPYAAHVLDAFGPDRVMYGSDWPVCLIAGSYARIAGAAGELVAGLSPAEQEAVFGGTAVRVYGLAAGGQAD